MEATLRVLLLLGPIGSGKSTYSRLISAIMTQLGYEVEIVDGDRFKGLTEEEVLKLGKHRNDLTHSAILEAGSRGKIVIVCTGGGALYNLADRKQEKNIFQIIHEKCSTNVIVDVIVPCGTSTVAKGSLEDWQSYDISSDVPRLDAVLEERNWKHLEGKMVSICHNNNLLQQKLVRQLQESDMLGSIIYVPHITPANRTEIGQYTEVLQFHLDNKMKTVGFLPLVMGQKVLFKMEGDQFAYFNCVSHPEPTQPTPLADYTGAVSATVYKYIIKQKIKWCILEVADHYVAINMGTHKFSDVPAIMSAIKNGEQTVSVPSGQIQTVYNLSQVIVQPTEVELKGEFWTL